MKINWPDINFGPVNLNTVVSAYHFYQKENVYVPQRYRKKIKKDQKIIKQLTKNR